MDLKEILGEELYKKVEGVEMFTEIKTAFESKKLVVNDGEKFVSRERLNQEIDKKKSSELQLTERDTTIKQMTDDLAKLKDVDPKKMKDEIQALTDKNTELETEYKGKIQNIQRSAKLKEI